MLKSKEISRFLLSYRIFNSPSSVPNAPIIPPTIQKRITMVNSFQPLCSKWWWIGAILKTFFLKNFFDVSWIMTDSASITNMNPIIGKIRVWSVSIAITPSVAPRASEPVSPM